MRRLFFILFFAACSTGNPLVVVTVSSPHQDLTALSRLHATATAAGHTREFDVSFADGQAFDLPPERTFGVEIPEAYAGAFDISVDAIDGNGATVISGAGATTTSPGQRSDVTIRFGESADLGGDGGMSCGQANWGCGMVGGVDCGPCQLTSLHPAIANAGDTVVLEGAFNPTVGVSFPGAAMPVMPELLGPNRATVVVPAGATAGAVSLQVGGVTASIKQPFRRVTFALALHEFHTAYQQTDAARPMADSSLQHAAGTGVLVGNTVEMLGGEQGAPSPMPVPVIEVATANADGTIGIFAPDPARSLITPRSAFAVYNSGSTLYVIGGYDGNHAALSTVERAAVRADGSGTDKFIAASISLMTPRWYPASAVVGRYLYVFGGGNGRFSTASAQVLKTAERAPINDDGTLGAFEAGMSPLSLPRAGATALVLRDRVYLIGGIDATGAIQSSIDSAPINGDGTLGTFSTSGPSLKTAHAVPGVVQLGGRVYVLGGIDPSAANNLVESAAIDGTGALTSFGAESIALKLAHAGQPLLFGNYLHYFEYPPGERAAIGGGTVGPFSDTGRSLQMPRSQAAMAVVGPDVYLMGGVTGTGPTVNIVHARADADGTLGAFTGMVNGNPLPDLAFARAGAATAVFERDLWICGGSDGTGGRSDCEGFTVHPDGSLSMLAVSADMTVKRAGFQLVISGGQLAAVGGDGGGWDSVQSIALDATRHPTGAWSAAATMQFPAKGNGRYAYLGDFTDYVLGGDAAGLAVVTANGAAGGFTASALVQGPQRFNTALLGLGSWVAVAGGTDQATGNAVDTVWLAPQGGDFADTARHLARARRGHSAIALGNYVYVLGGADTGGQLGSVEQAPLQ